MIITKTLLCVHQVHQVPGEQSSVIRRITNLNVTANSWMFLLQCSWPNKKEPLSGSWILRSHSNPRKPDLSLASRVSQRFLFSTSLSPVTPEPLAHLTEFQQLLKAALCSDDRVVSCLRLQIVSVMQLYRHFILHEASFSLGFDCWVVFCVHCQDLNVAPCLGSLQ